MGGKFHFAYWFFLLLYSVCSDTIIAQWQTDIFHQNTNELTAFVEAINLNKLELREWVLTKYSFDADII